MIEEILKKLISFNTSADQSNLPLIYYVQKMLEKAGYNVNIFGPKENKNLFAYKKTLDSRIILATHSDTVLASDNWKSDPFRLSRIQEKFYGLGVCDVKGILAANLSLALASKQDNLAILISFNEETDFAGATLIDSKIIKSNDIVIVGEPTSNEAIFDAKGATAYKINFIGKSAHGSNPEKGNSAILALSKFVTGLITQFERMFSDKFSLKFENGNQTFNLGQISGGDAINKVAEKAKLTIEFRFTEKSYLKKFDELLNRLKGESKVKISIDKFIMIEPFSASEKIKQELSQIYLECALGVSYCCEANFYNKLTDNCFIFGPGSINQAHRKDECIKIQEINQYQNKLKRVIKSIC